jgi:hypothetical protein
MQVTRTYIAGREAKTLCVEMGEGAVFIAEIVPELREKLPNLKPPPALELEQARFRLFDAFTTFLKNASDVQPLVLGTYRDVEVSPGHPLFRTLGELTRQRFFHRVLLRGLSRDESGRRSK